MNETREQAGRLAGRPVLSRALRGVVAVVAVAGVGVCGGLAGATAWLLLHLCQTAILGLAWRSADEASDLESGLARTASLCLGGFVAAVSWWAIRSRGRALVSVEKAVAGAADDGGAGGSRMPLGRTMANAATQIVAVALGVSVGKEVAPREFGAVLAQLFGAGIRVNARMARLLVACGASAGLAAIYDAPLGGAVFAIEVLLVEVSFAAVGTAMATSVIAVFVARALVQVRPPLILPSIDWSASTVWWAIAMGPIFALAGTSFTRLVTLARLRVPRGYRLVLALPAVCLVVGAVSLVWPQVLGNGISLFRAAVDVQPSMVAALSIGTLALVKTLVTAATLRAGAVGGTLMPSIAVGGALGASLAGFAGTMIADRVAISAASGAVIGASAVLAITLDAPVAALVLVAEFTGQTLLAVPAGLAVVAAVLVQGLTRRLWVRRAGMSDHET